MSYILSVLLLSGCLDIKLEDQYSDPDAISTTSTARELLASAYNSLPRHQMEFSVLSDDFVPTNLTGKYSEMQNLYGWVEKDIENLSDNVWNEYYMTVAIVNALLPRIDNIVPEDEDDKAEVERIRSEAKAPSRPATGSPSPPRSLWSPISSTAAVEVPSSTPPSTPCPLHLSRKWPRSTDSS